MGKSTDYAKKYRHKKTKPPGKRNKGKGYAGRQTVGARKGEVTFSIRKRGDSKARLKELQGNNGSKKERGGKKNGKITKRTQKRDIAKNQGKA